MSAILNLTDGSGQSLTATLTGTLLAPDDYKCMTMWMRFDSGSTNGTETGVWLGTSDGGSYIAGRNNTTPDYQVKVQYETLSKTAASSGTWSDDTWYLCGIGFDGDDGTTATVVVYQDGGSNTTTRTTPNTETLNFNTLVIGADDGLGAASNWHGWIADVAIWGAADKTEADAIVAAIWNSGTPKAADQISGTASPIWYDSLYDGIGNEVGTSLTNNGSVTFSTVVHPTLITGGGGSTAQPTAALIGL